mgnify:CR=1 FL=1
MSQVQNGKLRNFYNMGNTDVKEGGFDVVSCQFSIHYYFKTPEMINIYLNNYILNNMRLKFRAFLSINFFFLK